MRSAPRPAASHRAFEDSREFVDSTTISFTANANPNIVGQSGSFAFTGESLTLVAGDTTPPTVTVDFADDVLNTAGDSSTVTLQFSETVTGFDLGDLAPTNGTLSDFEQTDGDSYTVTFTASGSFEGTGTVSVAAGGYTDTAGNIGEAGSGTVGIDTLNPTVTVTIGDASLTEADLSSEVTFLFSEEVAGFGAEDIETFGATLSDLQRNSPDRFTATITAQDDFDGLASVSVTAGSYTDAVGNSGAAGSDTVDVILRRPEQRLAVDESEKEVFAGGTLEVPVFYSTLDKDGNPAALAANLLDANLHFDSSRLTFLGFVPGSEFTEGRVAFPDINDPDFVPTDESDVLGDDGDSATDTVLRTSFSDADPLQNPGWPNAVSLEPLQLYVARFQVAETTGSTQIHFSLNAQANVVGEAAVFGLDTQPLTVNVTEPNGNVDGDGDFDANDTFLINIVLLGATDSQIDLFKGASPLRAADLRERIELLRDSQRLDVDGDGDSDANDAFLSNIAQLGATDAQLNLFKGASPLSPQAIRSRVDLLFTLAAARPQQPSVQPATAQLHEPLQTSQDGEAGSASDAGSSTAEERGDEVDAENDSGQGSDQNADTDSLFVAEEFERLSLRLI